MYKAIVLDSYLALGVARDFVHAFAIVFAREEVIFFLPSFYKKKDEISPCNMLAGANSQTAKNHLFTYICILTLQRTYFFLFICMCKGRSISYSASSRA